MKRILLLLTCTLLLTGITKAQKSYIGINGITRIVANKVSDSAAFDQEIKYYYFLKNYGPGTYTGPIHVSYAVRDSGAAQPKPVHVDTVLTTNMIPNDSIPFSSTQRITNGLYHPGINVVVIWPVATNPNWVAKDTIRDTLYVIKPTGIATLSIEDLIKVYPNPATSEVQVSKINDIRTITLYDMNGKLAGTYSPQSTINIQNLERGVYLLHITLNNNQMITWRILKE